MVRAWTVNDTAADELSNTFTLTPTENSKVQVDFENVTLFDLPADNAKYTFRTSSRTPNDYGTERQIRKGGTIEFAMRPAEGYLIRNLDFQGGTVTRCALQADGSWSIRMEKVVSTITFKADIYSMVPLTITAPQNGTLTVKLGDTVLTDGAKLAAGDILTIAADPATGYTLDKLTVSGATKQPGGTYKVDAAAVSVSASFKSTGGTSGGGGAGGGGGAVAPTTYDIVIPSALANIVKADKTKAAAGDTVTLTVSGEGTLTVTDANGKSVALTDLGSGKYAFKMPSSKVNVAFAASGETKPCDGGKDCPSAPFKDVDTGKWYHVSIDYVLTHSMMNGVSGTSFAPNSNLTRGMLVQILFNLEGKPQSASASFSDVKADAWYAKAVGWAAANKVVTGYADGTFRPNAAVTREQAAAILYRYAQSKGIDVSVGEDTNILSYADALQASEYAIPALQWAVGAGVLNGKSGNLLAPTGTATRAEIAAIMQRWCEKIVQK